MDHIQIESVSVGTANRKVITKIMIFTLGVTRFPAVASVYSNCCIRCSDATVS